MTTFRKTYAMELAEALTLAILAIVLVTQFTTRSVAGVAFLVLWIVTMARIGAIVMAWSLDRRPRWTDEERRERAASMSRHPSGRLVHNHGPHDGPGLECPEYGGKDGTLRGACIIQADRQRATKETDR